MKIIAFAGSNSSKSINNKFIEYIAEKLSEYKIEVIRLTDFEIPLFSVDLENAGYPDGILSLHRKIREADAIIISVAEHNGNVTAFFKSIIDWVSRYDREFLLGKKWLLFSAAPGKRGGASALAIAQKTLNYFKGELIGTFSLSNFNKIYIDGDLVDKEVDNSIRALFNSLLIALNSHND